MPNTIEDLKNFRGGDNQDVLIPPLSIEHMQYLIDSCKANNLPLPELFPWSGGYGVQAEWEKEKVYLEVDSSIGGIRCFFVIDEKPIHCDFYNIQDTFFILRLLLEKYIKC